MSGLIEQILGENGAISQILPQFEARPSQITMANIVADAINKRESAIIEAGTGTGKTLGYLVPALLSGKRVIISTGTKNLQEQIFFKDIPLLAHAIGEGIIEPIMLKGRGNYLCFVKYDEFESEIEDERIKRWVEKTETGDRAELEWMQDNDETWKKLSSSSDECLYSKCPWGEDCYLTKVRKKAAQANVVVVNHHLLFSDLAMRRRGFDGILPPARVIVFDEAHSVEEIAVTYFGESISTGQLYGLAKELASALKPEASRIVSIAEALESLFDGMEERGTISEKAKESMNKNILATLRIHLKSIVSREEESVAAGALAQKASMMLTALDRLTAPWSSEWATWYEKRKNSITLNASPMDVSNYLGATVCQEGRTAVFTSATLSVNNSFEYIRGRLGIPKTDNEAILPSHFDFVNRAIMYVPTDLPTPDKEEFTLRAAERILKILKLTKGRALILVTSYQRLNDIYDFLQGKMPYRLFKQGMGPKSVLLRKFREDVNSVLIATSSFWEGVDVPGEALSCVIVDKLPFGSPGDPIVSGKIESIKAKGGNAFGEYQLPSAVVELKQGLGRLIRNNTDRGILSVLDSRIVASRYSITFINSLPNMQITHNVADIGKFLG